LLFLILHCTFPTSVVKLGMKSVTAVIMLFLSSVCFAQQMRVIGKIPPANSDTLYRIQVGAYRETVNAEGAFNRLQNAGLNPVYENSLHYRRVVLAGISAANIPHIINIMRNAEFHEVWIREDKITSGFSIISNGNGAVSEINDLADNAPLAIVQTIPSFNDKESTANTYLSNAPVVFFFNDKVYLNSIEDNLDIIADGKPVDGTITINEGANGFAVLTLTPNDPLPAGANISVTVRREMQDDGGNSMQNEISLSYIAEQGSGTNFDKNNFGFEAGDNGIAFTGDGAVIPARGDLVPFEGSRHTAISTGTRIVSANGTAIGSSSSQILLGPIQQPFSSLTFHYNFISAEFNEFVGSVYDDNAMVTIYGPKGVHTEIITSVNRVARKNERFANFPRMPDTGDTYAGHTGWQRCHIENINVGTPAYIIFTVTDVGDTAYSSILAIDALE